MLKIYHNPRCRKSREGLAVLEASGRDFEIVRYLDEPLEKSEIKMLLKALDMKAADLVRKGEAIWKSDYKGRELSEEEILEAMLLHPKLIERPVVLRGEKAVIGRPKENIEALLQ